MSRQQIRSVILARARQGKYLIPLPEIPDSDVNSWHISNIIKPMFDEQIITAIANYTCRMYPSLKEQIDRRTKELIDGANMRPTYGFSIEQHFGDRIVDGKVLDPTDNDSNWANLFSTNSLAEIVGYGLTVNYRAMFNTYNPMLTLEYCNYTFRYPKESYAIVKKAFTDAEWKYTAEFQSTYDAMFADSSTDPLKYALELKKLLSETPLEQIEDYYLGQIYKWNLQDRRHQKAADVFALMVMYCDDFFIIQ